MISVILVVAGSLGAWVLFRICRAADGEAS